MPPFTTCPPPPPSLQCFSVQGWVRISVFGKAGDNKTTKFWSIHHTDSAAIKITAAVPCNVAAVVLCSILFYSWSSPSFTMDCEGPGLDSNSMTVAQSDVQQMRVRKESRTKPLRRANEPDRQREATHTIWRVTTLNCPKFLTAVSPYGAIYNIVCYYL